MAAHFHTKPFAAQFLCNGKCCPATSEKIADNFPGILVRDCRQTAHEENLCIFGAKRPIPGIAGNIRPIIFNVFPQRPILDPAFFNFDSATGVVLINRFLSQPPNAAFWRTVFFSVDNSSAVLPVSVATRQKRLVPNFVRANFSHGVDSSRIAFPAQEKAVNVIHQLLLARSRAFEKFLSPIHNNFILEIILAKNRIQQRTHNPIAVVITTDKNSPIIGKKISCHGNPVLQHSRPAGILVVCPVIKLVAAAQIKRRVNVNALHPPPVLGLQGVQRLPIFAVHQLAVQRLVQIAEGAENFQLQILEVLGIQRQEAAAAGSFVQLRR